MKEWNSCRIKRWFGSALVAALVGWVTFLLLGGVFGPLARAQQGPVPIQFAQGGGGLVQFGGRFGRFPGQMQQDTDDTPDGVFLPVDRDTTRQWEKAKSLLDDGHYADAVLLLDEILQRGEDYFFKPEANEAASHGMQDETPAQGISPDRSNGVPGVPAPKNGSDSAKSEIPPVAHSGVAKSIDSAKDSYQSLKGQAQRLIGNMPAAGREAYELQFGATAQKMLKAAAAAGDIPTLEEIARRYFHTQAGYQATLLLGRHHLDHDRPLAAALCFQRLLDAPQAAATFEPTLSVLLATSWQQGGMPDRAQEVLLALKQKNPNAELHVAGHGVYLFTEDKQALAWLEATTGEPQTSAPEKMQQWTLVRGNPARNASSVGGIPLLTPLWRVSTTNHPTLEKSLAGIRQQFMDQGVAAVPSMQPLAVGNLVLMRTARDLLAVDFDSGKRLWPIRSSSDTSLEQMLNTSSSSSGNGTTDPQRNQGLIERFWQDDTFGTLSSDGQQVYLIDDLDVASVPALNAINGPIVINGRLRINGGGAIIVRGPMGMDGQTIVPKRFNKLTAHELRTQGKLKWEVGGQTGEDEPKLAGAFFLGPPLPLEGKLYILAEMQSSEIKLCVLDAKTGRLDWSQQVAIVEQNIQQDPLRRLAGCSPSYADGVLICPTTAGAVVAVDIANRTLLWGYKYQRDGSGMLQPGQIVMRGGGMWGAAAALSANPGERWLDSTITIADKYVLATPVESNELHCIHLIDGKLLWKQPRGENLYVGGVHHGTAVLVGRHQITLLTVADEKSSVKSKVVELPAGAMPSGRGFLSGDDYFLPLSSAEVAQIDLNSAQIVARAKSRKGSVPGNLVCYQGEVISQGIDYVETFFQRQPLEERIAQVLATKPDDPWALAHRGEISLEGGELDSAIADLRRAFRSQPDPFNRELLFEGLLAGLTNNFGHYRNALPELKQLVRDDHERGTYLRVRAAGLQQAGDISGAVDAYLKLAALEPHDEELEDLDSKLSVYRPRWVQAQLHELLITTAKAENRAAVDAALQRQLDQAIASQDIKALNQFVNCFGTHPLADQARELLLDKLSGPDTLLDREQLLLALENSSDSSRRTAAMVKLANLLRDAGQWQAALEQYHRVEAQAGQEPVWEGKNVQQILASLPESSPIRRAQRQDHAWPEGAAKVDKADAATRSQMRVFNTEIQGTREPFFSNVMLGRDLQHSEIVGVDGCGKDLFQISLADPNRGSMYRTTTLSDYAFVQGHILIVCTGYQVIGLDTLKTAGSGNRVLWTKDLGDLSLLNGNIQPPMRQNMPWGGTRRMQTPQSLFGDVALCGPHTLCFQHGRDVTAIDPLTGQVQWVRHGVDMGCDILGDDEMVVLAPSNGKAAQVLRTADGQLLGERTLAATPDKRWLNYGHCLLAFRDDSGGKVTLAMFDPWTQSDVWSETFSEGNSGGMSSVKGTVIDGESVALMQSDGHFEVLNLADGRKLIDERLEAEHNQRSQLLNIFVYRSAQQYVLVTNRPAPPTGIPSGRSVGDNRNLAMNAVPVISQMGEQISQLVSGHVYAFDRATGKPQWATPAYVEQQGLVMGQPSDLPVLTFVRNIQTIAMNRPSPQMRGSVLCLDKRTGRLVYTSDDLPFINNFDITGQAEDKTVTLNLNSQPPAAVTLTLTDAPVAPEPPYQAGAFEKAPSASDSKE